MLIVALIAMGATSSASVARAAPTFVFTDVTVARGIIHSRALALPEACDDMRNCALPWAGTVAAEDIDGDGDLDLYFTLAAGAGVLYQNQGGTFVDVTVAAGLDGAPVGGGVSLVDLDGDGDRDLLINPIATLAVPTNRPWLYISDASTRAAGVLPHFTEEGAARGLVAPRRAGISGMGVVVGDYDLDGALDVYFADWRDRDVTCDVPGARLFRSSRDVPGRFVNATLAAGVWAPVVAGYSRPYSFGGAFTDLDRDGVPDLLVTSDIESSELYWGRGDGAFDPGGRAAGIATDRTGMGSTLADYDNDGDLDLFVSAIYSEFNSWDGNRLYRHDAARSFSDQTDAAGLRDTDWAWGAVFTDLDNDGDVDLCVTSGTAQSLAAPAGYAEDRTRVFLNPSGPGAWEDVSVAVGVDFLRLGREVVALDFDADGDQDLLVVPHVGPPALLRNDAQAATDWVDVHVLGAAPALEAIGAFVTVTPSVGPTQVREVGTRAHFTGHGPRATHFGLGAGFFSGGGTLDVHVAFPDGGELVHTGVAASGTVTLSRAAASPATRAALPVPPTRDCDGDGFPDVCQPDCDGNDEPDVCQLAAHPEQDCDADRLIDSCAIGLGFVADCDGDGVPDVCGVPPSCAPRDAGMPDLGPRDAGPPDATVGSDLGPSDARVDPEPDASDGLEDLGARDLGDARPVDAEPGADAHVGADGGTRPPTGMRGGAGCAVGARPPGDGRSGRMRPSPWTGLCFAAALLALAVLRVRRRRRA